MPNRRSSGSFCSFVVDVVSGGTAAQTTLVGLDVAALGNGAEVFVLSNGFAYRYSSTSSQTTVGSTFVQPTTGGGCWIKQNSAADFAAEFRGGVSLLGSTASPTGLTWTAIVAGANHFAADTITSSFWGIDTTLGTIAYSGPSGKRFLIQTELTLSHSTSSQQQVQLDLSVGGSLEGTQTDTLTSTQNTIGVTLNLATTLTHSILISPNTGQNIFPVYRVVNAVSGLVSFLAFQLTITPIGQ